MFLIFYHLILYLSLYEACLSKGVARRTSSCHLCQSFVKFITAGKSTSRPCRFKSFTIVESQVLLGLPLGIFHSLSTSVLSILDVSLFSSRRIKCPKSISRCPASLKESGIWFVLW